MVSFHHRTVTQRFVAFEVRPPQPVGLAGAELTLHQVLRRAGAREVLAQRGAILILEAQSVQDAVTLLSALPLVANGITISR